MAWSPQLGMRVFDPREGAQIGLQAGQAFARAYDSAQDRQMEERKLAMMEEETRRRATLLNLQQMGLAQLRDEVSAGVPFQEALFRAGPKLYASNPAAIATAIENRARNEATQAYQQAQIQLRREAADSLDDHRVRQDEIRLEGLKQRATEEAGRAARDEARDKRADDREDRLKSQFQKQLTLRAAADATMKQIEKDLATQRLKLAERKYRLNPLVTEKGIRETIADLEKQRANRLVELGVEPAGTEAAAAPASQGLPALKLGAIVEQNGKRYRYQGGPMDDPASYVEIK